jgi:hypothetical protein
MAKFYFDMQGEELGLIIHQPEQARIIRTQINIDYL